LASRSATLNLIVPAGTDVGSFVVAANASLTLDDRAAVAGPISNVGSAGTRIGADATVAAVFSQSTLTVGDRTTISGAVNTTGPIQASPSSHIAGPVNTHAVLTPARVRTLNVLFPAADTPDLIVAPDLVTSAGPGRYGTVTINTRARLKLRTGTYYVESLDVEPQGVLDLDEQNGAVVIYTNQPFIYRGSVVSNAAGPNFLIGVVGSGTLAIERVLRPRCRGSTGCVVDLQSLECSSRLRRRQRLHGPRRSPQRRLRRLRSRRSRRARE
jgi:hypothetical protein